MTEQTAFDLVTTKELLAELSRRCDLGAIVMVNDKTALGVLTEAGAMKPRLEALSTMTLRSSSEARTNVVASLIHGLVEVAAQHARILCDVGAPHHPAELHAMRQVIAADAFFGRGRSGGTTY